mmetsp:Transcript_17078/g.24171  ORF Transcript_17078/g.24171 Transcript_17078/m.24171 type:complete len:103 (-) Transcript_17078:1156-1464(-)
MKRYIIPVLHSLLPVALSPSTYAHSSNVEFYCTCLIKFCFTCRISLKKGSNVVITHNSRRIKFLLICIGGQYWLDHYITKQFWGSPLPFADFFACNHQIVCY